MRKRAENVDIASANFSTYLITSTVQTATQRIEVDGVCFAGTPTEDVAKQWKVTEKRNKGHGGSNSGTCALPIYSVVEGKNQGW